jgi:hypothetical protein
MVTCCLRVDSELLELWVNEVQIISVVEQYPQQWIATFPEPDPMLETSIAVVGYEVGELNLMCQSTRLNSRWNMGTG